MASTNKTSNLELSQFIATDTPAWLVDYNGDMEKIDAGVGRVKELAETASTQAVGVASGLQTTNQNVTTLSGQVANVQNQANNNTTSVNGINQRLGNTDISGVGDGTITGAISMQNINFSTKTATVNLTGYSVPLKLMRSGNIVVATASGNFSSLASKISVKIGDIPTGYIPYTSVQTNTSPQNLANILISIAENGYIEAYNYNTEITTATAAKIMMVWGTKDAMPE